MQQFQTKSLLVRSLIFSKNLIMQSSMWAKKAEQLLMKTVMTLAQLMKDLHLQSFCSIKLLMQTTEEALSLSMLCFLQVKMTRFYNKQITTIRLRSTQNNVQVQVPRKHYTIELLLRATICLPDLMKRAAFMKRIKALATIGTKWLKVSNPTVILTKTHKINQEMELVKSILRVLNRKLEVSLTIIIFKIISQFRVFKL